MTTIQKKQFTIADADLARIKQAHHAITAVFHPMRRDIYEVIFTAERINVTDIYIKIRQEQCVASRHLSWLRSSGAVTVESQGKFKYYSTDPIVTCSIVTLAQILTTDHNAKNFHEVALQKLKCFINPAKRKILDLIYIFQSIKVSDIQDQLKLNKLKMNQSACSQLLKELREANLVIADRQGREIYYSLNTDAVHIVISAVEEFLTFIEQHQNRKNHG